MVDKDYLAQTVMGFDEFKKNSVKADKFISVTQAIIREKSETLIDDASVKRGEDWSALANQVVGSENF